MNDRLLATPARYLSDLTPRRGRRSHGLGLLWLIGLLVASANAASDSAPSLRVYSRLLDPREHPDYARRAVQPPSWETFGHRTQFTSLRGFEVQGERIVNYTGALDQYTRQFDLGNVIWPSYPILFATNLIELADEIKRRGLFLFDVWGYVPGSGPGGYWQQFHVSPDVFTTLQERLGDHWLGTDIGEQDGRYLGGYASQMTPSSGTRFEQYLHFRRHFERMDYDLGHKHALLVSLNFGHYLIKEGSFTMIGAETAQALPNSQVYYAFIRGAGKQYGVPWFGNASIFNRWGFKTYGSEGHSDGYQNGPTKGTSLSLLKRLLYSHILYNSMVVGFENGWLEGDHLSPIGRLQQSAQHWVTTYGQPGVMHTPVGILLDFYGGWTFPRHLYTDKVYRVWGNLPYGLSDYLTDGILDLLYPGYQDSSYFHDESGFVTATPYGDIADCLLSDAPAWVLARYPVLVVVGELSGGRETTDKLLHYAAEGGHAVLVGGYRVESAAPLPLDQAATRTGPTSAGGSGEAGPQCELIPVSTILRAAPASGSQRVTVTRRPCGRGWITAFGLPPGLIAPTAPVSLTNRVDQHLSKPVELPKAIRSRLDALFRQQRLFEVDPRLSLITCRLGPGRYTLGIANPTWHELPLHISSRCGRLETLDECLLDQSEKEAVGYLPEGVDATRLGRNDATTIAGGDIRLFTVKVSETGVTETHFVPPPPRPRGRLLALRQIASIRNALLARPTFFEHADGVVVDWTYLHERERAALEAEGAWVRGQGLRVAVDLSSGLDLFPGLRLIDNLPAEYGRSFEAVTNVLSKMPLLGAHELLLSLHRYPENNFTDDQTKAAFVSTLRELSRLAADQQVTLFLRLTLGKPPWSLAEAAKLLEQVGASNLRLAPSLALLQAHRVDPATIPASIAEKVGLWLVSAPRRDVAGELWDTHAPVAGTVDEAALACWLALRPQVPIVLDANFATPDDEYLEALALDRLRPPARGE